MYWLFVPKLIHYKNGQCLDRFGGVILTRSERSDIQTIDDLKDKKIVAVDSDSLGGYAAQMHELFNHGMHADKLDIHFTGMPHKQVIKEVLEGKADVGFVRTDILEGMEKEGSVQFLLPNTPVAYATQVAEHLRQTIELLTFDIEGHITCSFGVSELNENEVEDALLRRVDELLYTAKANGRNLVVAG